MIKWLIAHYIIINTFIMYWIFTYQYIDNSSQLLDDTYIYPENSLIKSFKLKDNEYTYWQKLDDYYVSVYI